VVFCLDAMKEERLSTPALRMMPGESLLPTGHIH